MGELNKIIGGLEIKAGTASSTDIVHEWKDENGKVLAHLLANGKLIIYDTDNVNRKLILNKNTIQLTGNAGVGNYIYGDYNSYIRMPVNNGDDAIVLQRGNNSSSSSYQSLIIKQDIGTSGNSGWAFTQNVLFSGSGGDVRSRRHIISHPGSLYNGVIQFGASDWDINTAEGNHVKIAAPMGRNSDGENSKGRNIYLEPGEKYSGATDGTAGDVVIAEEWGYVGIGTEVPITKLDVSGGNSRSLRAITADDTLTLADSTIIADTPSGNVKLDLMSAASAFNSTDNTGMVFTIKRKALGNANTFTIDADGAELIDGMATKTLLTGESVTIQSDGVEWHIISN